MLTRKELQKKKKKSSQSLEQLTTVLYSTIAMCQLTLQ